MSGAGRTRAASILLCFVSGLACGPSQAPGPGGADEAGAQPDAVALAAQGDPTQGELLYGTYCASCHGARGAGDGPVAAGLDPKPARHDDGPSMNRLSDEHLFRVIRDGGAAVGKSPLMAPWGEMLSDPQIRDLVAYVRSLASPAAPGS